MQQQRREESTPMGSIITTPASLRHENIIEKAKNFCSQISSLFFVIIAKIRDAGDAVIAAMRSIEVDLLKESLGIFHSWFTWFLGSIFALKFTDAGKAFFSANYSVMKAMFLIKFFSCLTTLFQMRTRNMAPLLLMLLLDSGTCLLAVSMISRPILWTSLILWLCIFVLFGYCCYPELKEQILQIKTWIWNHHPEGPSIPMVTENVPADSNVFDTILV